MGYINIIYIGKSNFGSYTKIDTGGAFFFVYLLLIDILPVNY